MRRGGRQIADRLPLLRMFLEECITPVSTKWSYHTLKVSRKAHCRYNDEPDVDKSGEIDVKVVPPNAISV